MARTSYKTFLMKGTTASNSTTYAKLCDIKEFPDLGKAPDTIDVTTLSDGQKVYLPDILDPGTLEFNANYDAATYDTLKALEGVTGKYAVWFGATESQGVLTPDGSAGKFEFEGQLSVWVKGAGVSAPVDMGIAIVPSSKITKVASQ